MAKPIFLVFIIFSASMSHQSLYSSEECTRWKNTQIDLHLEKIHSWYNECTFIYLSFSDVNCLNFKNIYFLKFDLNTSYTTIEEIQLNLLSNCILYVTVTNNLESIVPFFNSEEKELDKYFLSRKHVVFVDNQKVDFETFFKHPTISTYTNLVLIILNEKEETVRIITHKPYLVTGNPITHLPLINSELETYPKFLLETNLKDFHGYRFSVLTFHFPPRIFMTEEANGSYTLKGLDYQIVKSIGEMLNLSLEFKKPNDGQLWGWEQDNGTWTGLMGDLQYHRADLAVADLYVMEPYFKITDMSVEYDIEYLCFVNPVQGPLPQWIALYLPFSLEMWLLFMLTIIGGIFFFIFLSNDTLMTGLYAPKSQTTSAKAMFIFGHVVTPLQKPWPFRDDLRVFVLFWSIGFLVSTAIYKGLLFSFLTMPLEKEPIDTHRQLYDRDVAVGSLGNTFQRLMEKNADPWVRKLAKKYEILDSTDEGLRKTSGGSFSFLESRGFLDYAIAVDFTNSRGEKSLHVMKEYIAPFGVAVAFPKYVPYIDTFNVAIRRLRESGLTQKWLTDIIQQGKRSQQADTAKSGTKKHPNENNVSGQIPGLSLDNLQGGFVVLLVGEIFAFIVLILEVSMHRCYKMTPKIGNRP